MLNKLNVKRYINDETGVSLLIAVMTLLVLSIIGVTLATVTFANVKLTTTDREYQSAYYIAEAGVNETYAKIKELILESYADKTNESDFYSAIESVLLADISDCDSTLKNFERSLGVQPEAQISITKIDDGNPRTYQISSEGKIGQRERTVTKEFIVNWVPKGGPSPMPYLPEGVGAIVKNKVNLSGSGTIDGDLYLDTNNSNSIKVVGGAKITSDVYVDDSTNDSIFDVPNWMSKPELKESGFEFDWDKLYLYFDNFPTAPNYEHYPNLKVNGTDAVKDGNLTVNSNTKDYELFLDKNYHFNIANFGNNNTLTINVGNHDRVLVFERLNLTNGHIKINGTGNLTIYVKEEIKFSSRPQVNFNGAVNQLTLYYEGSSNINFTTVDINANILIKQADVTYGSGGGREGLLISGGKNVAVTNGAVMDSVIVAPYAKVILSGNETSGVIIAEELEITGGTTLKYKQLDSSNFPFDFITVPNEPAPPSSGGGDTGGLLTPKPNTE